MPIEGVEPRHPDFDLCECGHERASHSGGMHPGNQERDYAGRCFCMINKYTECPCERFIYCADIGFERDNRPPKPCCERLPDGGRCTLPMNHPEPFHDPNGHLRSF